MKVYLATSSLHQIADLVPGSDLLVSYIYSKQSKELTDIIPKTRNFILDSGIFTMINSGKRFDMDRYCIEYGNYVKENGIKNYVELDVDQIIGVEQTRRLRDRLEAIVGYPSIPVWHSVRGKDSFVQDARDYDYMALGFFLTEGLPVQVTSKYAGAFVKLAHENRCRIHGLGFTRFEELKRVPFDSVDSSTWSAGCRYGSFFTFNARKGKVETQTFRDRRMKSTSAMRRQAFIEWRKYQDWAYSNLLPIWK